MHNIVSRFLGKNVTYGDKILFSKLYSVMNELKLFWHPWCPIVSFLFCKQWSFTVTYDKLSKLVLKDQLI